MKTIIFDFGGVFNYEDSIQKFWQLNANYYNIDPEKANKITLDIWLKARVGKIDSNIFWIESAKFAGTSADDFKKRFLEYTGFRDDLLVYIKKELSGKYKLGMISNQIEAWLGPILKDKRFYDVFDRIITSYDVGIAKPDIRLYEIICRDLNVEAKDCVYIDDQNKNLEPASDLGMKVIKFKDTESFKTELEKIL